MSEDRSADLIDEANIVAARFTADAIASIQAAAKAPPPDDFDGKTCTECGADIPEKRLETGAWLCVDCKTLEEEANARRRRTYAAPGGNTGWPA